MRRTRIGRAPWLAGIAALAAVLSACGSGGSAGTGGSGSSGSGKAPEVSHIVVDTLPIPDAAPLFIAIKNGYFKQQGLTVTTHLIQGSPQANAGLVAGTVDFTTVNYVSTLELQQAGTIHFRIVSPELSGAPNVMVLMVPKNSPITSLSELKGKTIAAPEQSNGIGQLAVAAALKPEGISLSQVTFKEIPFPDMGAALANHEVDAAWVNQPFVAVDTAKFGDRVLDDTLTGPMAGFPVSGWGTTAQFAQKNPKTVAAFQRAMAKAQHIAATDPAAVRQILPTYSSVTPAVAKAMSLGAYPTSLTAATLQRVNSMMVQFGMLKSGLDVASMIVPQPSS